MVVRITSFLLAAALLVGCVTSSPTATVSFPSATGSTQPLTTLTPVPNFVNETTPERADERVQAVQLLFYPASQGPFTLGSQVKVIIEARPVLFSRLYDGAGEILGTSILPWENHRVAEMDIRLGWDQEGEPRLELKAYQERMEYTFTVDWLGEKLLRLEAGFRDGAQLPVLIYLGQGDPVITAQQVLEFEGVWDQSTPVQALPAPIQTIVAQTQSAYPLTGAVQWEEGRCCAGGTAGETIQVKAGFSANSPQGEVKEMRLRTGSMCFTENELEQSLWEPFVLEKSFPFTLAINWIGYFISVQYRDSTGALSPVYCDDISLEGMPPRTP